MIFCLVFAINAYPSENQEVKVKLEPAAKSHVEVEDSDDLEAEESRYGGYGEYF